MKNSSGDVFPSCESHSRQSSIARVITSELVLRISSGVTLRQLNRHNLSSHQATVTGVAAFQIKSLTSVTDKRGQVGCD